ncbi:MAG: septum formation family protein [Micrococcales bacterium]|nr:septum formation family protein [Micrococcales bacterium]
MRTTTVATALVLMLAVGACGPGTRTTNSQDLRPGDCLDGTLDSVATAEGDVATIWMRTMVTTVACDQPHSSEVVHRTEERAWTDDEAKQTCTEAAADYTGTTDPKVTVNASYLGGAKTRHIICYVTTVDGEKSLTRSVRATE